MDLSLIYLLDCHFSVLCIMAFTSPGWWICNSDLYLGLLYPPCLELCKIFRAIAPQKKHTSQYFSKSNSECWSLIETMKIWDTMCDSNATHFNIQRGGGADIMHLPSLRDFEKINHFCGAWKRLNSDNMHALCIKLCLLPAFDKIWKMKCQCMQNCGFLKAWKGGCFKCNINSRFNNFAR